MGAHIAWCEMMGAHQECRRPSCEADAERRLEHSPKCQIAQRPDRRQQPDGGQEGRTSDCLGDAIREALRNLWYGQQYQRSHQQSGQSGKYKRASPPIFSKSPPTAYEAQCQTQRGTKRKNCHRRRSPLPLEQITDDRL